MTGKNILLLSLVFLICECNSVSFARDYEFLDLSTLGGRYSLAFAINNNGQVVGESSTSANPYSHAFIWDIGTGMQDLGTSSYFESSAYDINDLGQVVCLENGKPFIWSNTDSYTSLYQPGNNTYYVNSINNSGQVVGGIGGLGYIWNTPTELERLGPDYMSAINNSGQMVGYSTQGNPPWIPLTSISSFIDPVENKTYGIGSLNYDINITRVTDLNNYGIAVGYSGTDPLAHGFIWDQVNGIRDIGTLGLECFPQAINDLGQVVGYSNLFVDGKKEMHAFLWDEINGMYDLGNFGEEARAFDINNAGQIVGTYRTPSGYLHAFLLTPVSVPEPSLMISYLLGLMWIVKSIIRRK